MYRRMQKAPSLLFQRICNVDKNTAIFRLNPKPLLCLWSLKLAGPFLAPEQSYRASICVGSIGHVFCSGFCRTRDKLESAVTRLLRTVSCLQVGRAVVTQTGGKSTETAAREFVANAGEPAKGFAILGQPTGKVDVVLFLSSNLTSVSNVTASWCIVGGLYFK